MDRLRWWPVLNGRQNKKNKKRQKGDKTKKFLLRIAEKYGNIAFVEVTCERARARIMNIRLHGQAVKTSPFHGGNTGSIPVGVI